MYYRLASGSGFNVIEQKLVQAKVDLDIKDHMGCSAIVYGKFLLFLFLNCNFFTFKAAMNGRSLILNQLIAAGADINSATNEGETSLMFGKLKI